jgi:hypothetical protein
VDNATTLSELLWKCPSHSDGLPPSPPDRDNLRFVRISWIFFNVLSYKLVDNLC